MLAVVALIVAAAMIVAAVVQFRSTVSSAPSTGSGNAATGMTLGTVRTSDAQPEGRLELTVGYVVAGAQRTLTGRVSGAAYEGQGKTVWVCFEPADPAHAYLRLPMDDLCS